MGERKQKAWSRAALAGVLRRATLFEALSEGDLSMILRDSTVKSLPPGGRLWRRGERAAALGVVLSGRMKIVRPAAHDVVIGVALPADVLGEVAFTTRATYQEDVIGLRASEVLLVPARSVRAALASNPRLALSLALDLAAQVMRLTRLAEDLSAGSVEARLARVLLRLAETTGEPFPGGILIPLRLRRSDLAAMAATTIESTSRRISDWQRRGWVVAQPAGYLVRNSAALHSIAHE